MIKNIDMKKIPQEVYQVCTLVKQTGGRAWLVGGCVRDLVLGNRPNDWDVEAYGLAEPVLMQTLKDIGHCEQVGKQFGVIKLWVESVEIDVALPRTEKKEGRGHTGFAVVTDVYLTPEQSVLRRDFTINALMLDPLTDEFLDFHQGLEDLGNKKLRHVSLAFVEDPLRPLRAMQFAARFQLTLTQDTADLCRKLLAEYQSLPASRVWQEWLKWAGAEYPSYGLRALQDMGWLSLYPQLEALMGCPQDKKWHPEGDVWIHTCLVVDAAAALSRQRRLDSSVQAILVFAALCHDLGKPSVTEEDASGDVVAPEHGAAGVKPTSVFLVAISMPKTMKQHIVPLVREHIAHFSEDLTVSAVMRLAYRLMPTNIRVWEMLTQADAAGCPPLPVCRPAQDWLGLAERIDVGHQKAKPIITGKLLMAWGVPSSPRMGRMLEGAYQAQMDAQFSDEKSAHSWVNKYHIATDGN